MVASTCELEAVDLQGRHAGCGEEELAGELGPVSDRVMDQVKETGQDALDRGKQVAQEAVESAKDTAKESGKEQGMEMAEHVKETAREVAPTGGGSSRSG